MTVAAGNTTLPMSRPSATMPRSATSAQPRCSSTSRARTCGTAATALTWAVTSGPRIGPETSWPSTVMVGPAASVPETITGLEQATATASRSSTSTSLASIHQVIARYIAPVSRKLSPSRAATARETVDLPEPEGPSMATTTGACARSAVSTGRTSL